jgi:hypothetical protein
VALGDARLRPVLREHLISICDACSPDCPNSPVTTSGPGKLAATMGWLSTRLAQETSVYTDDVWVADSSPVECACTNAEEVLIESSIAHYQTT